jgi:aspartate racemase
VKTVGILGGMGPEATVALMARVIAGVAAQDDADHVPLIVDQNPQVPSRIRHLIEGTGEDPTSVLVAMAQRLQGAGATALAMPCNTAHAYVAAIRAAVTIPFIDMVALSVAQARSHVARTSGPTDPIGLLCSPAVRLARVFDAPLAAAALTPVFAPDDPAMALIRQVKRKGATSAARDAFRALALSVDAPVQLVACTEFSLLADTPPPGITFVDTLDVLTRAIIAYSTGQTHG